MDDPQLLQRAARPGRIRGITLDLLAAAEADPAHASGILRRGLREARALHSRERRLAADALRDLQRLHGRLVLTLGTDDPLARWLGWLVWRGLPADDAAAAWSTDRTTPAPPFTPDLDAPLAGLPADEALAARGSLPLPLARALLNSLGEHATAFLDACEQRAPVVIRVPRGRRDAVLAALPEGRPAALAPNGIILPPGTDLRSLAALTRTPWELQDEASQAVGALVAPEPGDRVLDACAGAGGKALQLAAEHPHASIYALDIRQAALDELRHRARDAGLRVHVAVDRPGFDVGPPFDVVLVDAPCSGSGTWRRHPELRWRAADRAPLHALQAELLDRNAARVRPGGRLVYATCSVLRDENDDQVAAFLTRHPGWRLLPAATAAADGPFLRTAPHTHGTDGFFAAVMVAPG